MPRGLSGAASNRAGRSSACSPLFSVRNDAKRSPQSSTLKSRPCGQRGLKRGIAEAVAWAKPTDDGQLRSRVEVDEIREVGADHVAVAARRQWRWAEGDELADEAPFGALFELRDGRVSRWRQDFDSIVDAIESIPAEH